MSDLTDHLLNGNEGLDHDTPPWQPQDVRGRSWRTLILLMAAAAGALLAVGFVLAVIGARALDTAAAQDTHIANHRQLIGATVHGLTNELTRQAARPPSRRDLAALVGSARLGLVGSGDNTPVITTRVAVSTADVLATVTVVTSDGYSTTLVHEARREGTTIALTGCSAISNLDQVYCDPRLASYLNQQAH